MIKHLGAWSILASLVSCQLNAEVLITEYVEGSSNNKAIEITNMGDTPVELGAGGYALKLFSNGRAIDDPYRTEVLTGSLAAGESLVLVNSAASAELLVKGEISAVTGFNGDDAVGLFANDQLLDKIGQIGVDPGSSWNDGTVSTLNHTLRRKEGSSADIDNAQPFYPSNNWIALPQDTIDGLGCGGENACDDQDNGQQAGVIELGYCGDEASSIHSVQGMGATSPLVGERVVVEGIVVGEFQGDGSTNQLSGFFVQQAAAEQDADPSTSEGVFIYHIDDRVAVGDRVRLLGTVAEYYDNTQIGNIEGMTICASGQTLPQPTALTLPLDSSSLEALEGMYVELPQRLHVTLSYDFNRYGEMVVSNGKLIKPTQLYPANSSEADELQTANSRNRLLVDDGSSAQNPATISYYPELSAVNSLRSGSMVTGLRGVIQFAYGQYRLQPTALPTFEDANPRVATPKLSRAGNLTVASMNVLNYFTSIDTGGTAFRGADSEEEFARQQAKIVAALTAMNADIVGLMELENNGFSSASAIAALVDAVNTGLTPALQYQFVEPEVTQVGADAITVGMLYRPAVVTPVAPAQLITGYPFDPATAKHRVPLSQRFVFNSTQQQLTVVVNHFKSKGSSCDDLGDPDLGDGQGNCNQLRSEAAQTLVDTYGAQPNVLLIGDFNAYAKEDPIIVFEDNGYTNLAPAFDADAYSYYFDEEAGSLDHAIANGSLLHRVIDATDWHINADEPRGLDYNTEYKSESQIAAYYRADPYRASDHDPVLIRLDMRAAGTIAFSANELIVAEGETGLALVSRTGGDFGEVVIGYQILGQSADSSDIVLAHGELVWADGEMGAKAISVQALTDDWVEKDETATIRLSLEQGAAQLSATHKPIIITDTNELTVAMAQSEMVVNEGNGVVDVPLVLNGEAQQTTRAWVLVVPHTASFNDFRGPILQKVSWSKGEAGRKFVHVRIKDDRRKERTESLAVYLLGSAQVASGDNTRTALIIEDND